MNEGNSRETRKHPAGNESDEDPPDNPPRKTARRTVDCEPGEPKEANGILLEDCSPDMFPWGTANSVADYLTAKTKQLEGWQNRCCK